MGNRETIVLGKDCGQSKKGDVFVRGDLSHGVPEHYKTRGKNDPKEWYWKKGTDKSECKFLHVNNFTV